MKFRVYELSMETLSPLYTGEIKTDVREKKRESLKVNATRIDSGHAVVHIHGAMRANLEKILRARGENVCDTGGKGAKTCGRCLLCDLFGSLGRAGRLIADDMVSEKPASEIVSVTVHTRLDRETRTVSDTLQMEEVQPGAKFKGRLIILNPQPRDDELVQAAINAINEFGVGGWVNRGRGRVKLEIVKKEEKEWASLYPVKK